jgi:FtsZ-interacting cell division protein ZipA
MEDATTGAITPLITGLVIVGSIFLAAVVLIFLRTRNKQGSTGQATFLHPREYQDLDDDSLGIGPVMVKKAWEESQAENLEAGLSETTDPSDQNEFEFIEPQAIIALHIKAPPGQTYDGMKLADNMPALGLEYGKHGIYHFFEKKNDGRVATFSMANMVNPGHFKISDMENFETVGVSLFMGLPNVSGNALNTFSSMLGVAQKFVKLMGGQIQNEHRQPLTPADITTIRERIVKLQKANKNKNRKLA